MANSRKWLSGVLFFLALSCPALARDPTHGPPPEEMREHMAQSRAWQSAAAEMLMDQGSADALFTAAMLLPRPIVWYEDPEGDHSAVLQQLAARRLQLLDRAAALAPQSGEIAAAAMYLCRSVDGCDMALYAEQLHRAVPNGAAWLMPALQQARERQDPAEVTRIVQRMGEATVFDSHYGASMQLFARATSGVPLPAIPDRARIEDEFGDHELTLGQLASLLASTYAMNNQTIIAGLRYLDLVQACKPERPEFAARRDACRQIGMALTHASSIIHNRIGLALRRFAAIDEVDLAVVEANTRTRDWVMHAFTQTDQVNDLSAYQRAVVKHGSEHEAMTAMVAAAGLPITPPAGWVSRRELRETRQVQSSSTEDAAPSACHDIRTAGED